MTLTDRDMLHESDRHEPRKYSLKTWGGLAIIAGLAAVLGPVGVSRSGQSGVAESEHQCAGPLYGYRLSKSVESIASKLIFVSNRSGKYRIYEKDLASGSLQTLTSGEFNSMNPQLSPDRTRLVFYTDQSGSNQIATLSLKSPTDVMQLTRDSGGVQDYDPVYTPDGHILYKKTDTQGNYGDIWEMKADGSNQHNVTPGLIARHIEAWKPVPVNDSEAVITERSRPDDPYSDNLFVLQLSSGHTVPLTNNSLSNWFPDYDASMQRLVFITKQAPGEHDVLATMRPDGLDCRVVVHLAADNNDPSWSADGRYIAFVNNKGGDYSTYVAESNGGTVWLVDRSPKGSDDLSPLLLG